MKRFENRLAAYTGEVMHKDHYLWRCMCGNENLITSLDCHKCREQRWAQLGFDRERAQELALKLTPVYLQPAA